MSTNDEVLVQAAAKVLPDARPDIDAIAAVLPQDVTFSDDIWNVSAWGKARARPDAFNLAFDRIAHMEMRETTKMIVLMRRIERSIGPGRAATYVHTAQAIGDVLGARPVESMTSQDAHQAAKLLLSQSHTYLSTLATFVHILRRLYGVAVRYNAPKTAEARHGTKGTDKGRKAKRISDLLLKSILHLLHRDDLADDDRLFLSTIAFNLACGWRIGELLTLPKDCLMQDEGALYVRGLSIGMEL